jgi:hypothetical protein
MEADGHVEAVGIRSGLGPTAHRCEKSGSGETSNRIIQEGSSVHEANHACCSNLDPRFIAVPDRHFSVTFHRQLNLSAWFDERRQVRVKNGE